MYSHRVDPSGVKQQSEARGKGELSEIRLDGCSDDRKFPSKQSHKQAQDQGEIHVYYNRTTGFPSNYNEKLSDASKLMPTNQIIIQKELTCV